MKIRELIDTGVTLIVLLVAAGLVIREFRGSDQNASQKIEDWRDTLDEGIWIGPKDADVIVSEFTDLQCPYCAEVAPTIDSLLTENSRLALVLHHFPLSSHPHAEAAAVALECAARQGVVRPMVRTLFAQQPAVGVKPWREFASEAGVADIGSFEACVVLPADSFPRISEGKALGQAYGIRGTPTLWVDDRVVGWGGIRKAVEKELR